ncbi:hypothetical protein Q3G72_032293 [Acer saccharum]|nr:hypothetical protein Q3G72_032293 [Acer saccharum]
MEFLQTIKKPYQAVLDEKWGDMEKHYNDISEDPLMRLGALLCPISVDRDTAFHLAVYSGEKQPLCRLLELVEKDGADGILSLEKFFMQNIYGNTVLHEAAIRGNLEAVEILIAKFPKLIEDKNEFGETPLFRAAAFGKRRIVKYLASQPDQVVLTDNGEKHLQIIHRQRKDGTSILHAAIQGEHFGTALQLLEFDEELANLKYDNGTSLYVLANTPSLFKRGCEMNIFMKLLYNCLPVGNYLNEDAETNSGQNFCLPKDIPIDDTENIVEVKNGETNSGRNDNGCLAKGIS